MSPIYVELREARQKAGLSQRELAAKAGVRHAAISHIETGRAQRIDLDLLERLCRALGVQPSSLFQMTPRTRKRQCRIELGRAVARLWLHFELDFACALFVCDSPQRVVHVKSGFSTGQ